MKQAMAPMWECLRRQVLSGPPRPGRNRPSLDGVDNRREIREFLTSRRARITPEQAGLPAYGGNRRVAGLRREEVAMLAGVSADYYVRLERGSLVGASDSVLEAIARALQLDDAERDHLFDLARAANATAAAGAKKRAGDVAATRQAGDPAGPRRDHRGRRGRAQRARRHRRVQPARVRALLGDPRRDGTTTQRGALHLPQSTRRKSSSSIGTRRPAMSSPFCVPPSAATPMTSRSRTLSGNCQHGATTSACAGPTHNVRRHTSGSKRMRHPVIGEIELNYQSFEMPGEPGLRFNVFTAEPDTPNQEALRFLASWAATTHARAAEVEQAANERPKP